MANAGDVALPVALLTPPPEADPEPSSVQELPASRLRVVGAAQGVQEFVNHRVIALGRAVDGELRQVVSEHVLRVDGVHALAARVR